MKTSTVDFVRHLVSDHLGRLCNYTRNAHPAPQLADDIRIASDALADIVTASNEEPKGNPDADLALGRLVAEVNHLREIDSFFANGTGKGSAPHKAIRGLLAIAERNAPRSEPQPETSPAA